MKGLFKSYFYYNLSMKGSYKSYFHYNLIKSSLELKIYLYAVPCRYTGIGGYLVFAEINELILRGNVE